MTEVSSYDGWIPPAFAKANFSDCKVAATWLSGYINSVYTNDTRDTPLTSLYDYIVSMLPANYTRPSLGQAVDWYADMDTEYVQKMVLFPVENCTSQTCENITWTGDSDLAGVGIIIIYYLSACMASLYFLLMALDQWPFENTQNRHYKRWRWFMSAFRESLPVFIDTGLIFSLAISVAGAYRHASARMHPDKTHSLYALTNATYMSIFTAYTPLLLQIIVPPQDMYRRLRIRCTLWFGIVALAITNVVLYYTLMRSDKLINKILDRQSALLDTVWEVSCEEDGIRHTLEVTLAVCEIVLLCSFIWWFLQSFVPVSIRSGVFRWSSQGQPIKKIAPTAQSNLDRITRVLNGLICCGSMWAMLFVFTAYRGSIEDRMGSSNQDGQWGFGQVLSLATWVPVGIEIITIYMYGARQALEEKVSTRFRVVEAPQDNRKSFEMSIGEAYSQNYGGKPMTGENAPQGRYEVLEQGEETTPRRGYGS